MVEMVIGGSCRRGMCARTEMLLECLLDIDYEEKETTAPNVQASVAQGTLARLSEIERVEGADSWRKSASKSLT